MDMSLDWTLVQSFLAVAEAGSLSAAARATGQSQPTLGRHIHAAETRLGARLFDRRPRGLELTEAGTALLPAAKKMREAAAEFALTAAGRDAALAGTVRVTASEVVAFQFLPAIIARLRQDEPLIQIELVPNDLSENLLFREADIALRMYRPDQLDIVARRLTELPLGFYAAKSYLDRVGRPAGFDAMLALDWVGFDRSDLFIRGMREAGAKVGREFFPVRCDAQVTHWELVRRGCGVGVAQRRVADRDPLVERLLPDGPDPMPPLQLWLATPEALRRVPRVARVWDALVAEFEW